MLLGVAGFFLYRYAVGEENKRRFLFSGVSLMLTNMGFAIGLYQLYLTSFGGGTPSYPRYISTLLTANLTFLAMVFLQSLPEKRVPGHTGAPAKTAITVWLTVCFFSVPLRAPINYDGGWMADAVNHGAMIARTIETQPENPPDGKQYADVYLAIEGSPKDNAGLHHRIYFDLIGSDIRIRNFYSTTNIPAIGAGQWRENLTAGGYDYVYLLSSDPLLEDGAFDALFDGPVTAKTLYKVQGSGEDLVLVPLETAQIEW